MKKSVLGVIPARLDSKRLSGKMLLDMCGKPMIVRTLEQAQKAKTLDDCIVATDSKEIADAVVRFGGVALMTSSRNRSGTDRVAEAVKKFKKFIPEIIINIQGDQPLIDPCGIDALVRGMKKSTQITTATLATRLTDENAINTPKAVKVVCDRNHNALYFSRSPLPYARNDYDHYLRHIGVYGFRRAFLLRYAHLKPTPLELAEGLEQLRILEHGFPIRIIPVDIKNYGGIDTQEQFDAALSLMQSSH